MIKRRKDEKLSSSPLGSKNIIAENKANIRKDLYPIDPESVTKLR